MAVWQRLVQRAPRKPDQKVSGQVEFCPTTVTTISNPSFGNVQQGCNKMKCRSCSYAYCELEGEGRGDREGWCHGEKEGLRFSSSMQYVVKWSLSHSVVRLYACSSYDNVLWCDRKFINQTARLTKFLENKCSKRILLLGSEKCASRAARKEKTVWRGSQLRQIPMSENMINLGCGGTVVSSLATSSYCVVSSILFWECEAPAITVSPWKNKAEESCATWHSRPKISVTANPSSARFVLPPLQALVLFYDE